MPTIADVARRAGVSIATVSRVLSPSPEPHPVRSTTAERVRAAAHELNFVPSPLASGLAAGRTGLIGLVVPDLTDPHYPQIASGVEDAARSAGLAVLICNTLGDAERLADYVRLLHARRVDAIVLSGGTRLGADELAAVSAANMPVVLIGRPIRGVRLPWVGIDNLSAARRATEHLIALGRRHVMHLGGPASQTTMTDRANGYRAAMRDAHLPPDVLRTSGTPEQAYERLYRRLTRSELGPNAIFAAADRLAVAALAAVADAGLDVPRDVAIVGVDDIPVAAHLRPSLSSVAQPARQLGEIAIDMARRLLSGERVKPIQLEADLVVRQSSTVLSSRGRPQE